MEITIIRNQASLISPVMPTQFQDPATWFDNKKEPDSHALSGMVGHTNVVLNPDHYGGTACVFLRNDYKCALQVAAQINGKHPWYFKPFYCILHPLDLDDQGRITIDDLRLMKTEPASCLRNSKENISLLTLIKPELSYFLGENDIKNLER